MDVYIHDLLIIKEIEQLKNQEENPKRSTIEQKRKAKKKD